MKRIKLVGLCILVAGAFAAIAGVSTAAAASPEYGVCVSQKKGKYENSGCTKLAAKKGSFEWHAADSCYAMKKGNFTESGCKTVSEKKGKPAHKGTFELAPSPTYTSKSIGSPTLETPGLGSVTCKADTDVGKITGASSDEDQVFFTGCETQGKKCHSIAPGEPAKNEGEIITEHLATSLTEPKAGTVDTKFEDNAGPEHFQAWFECEGPQFETTGFVSGVDSPINVMGTSALTDFAAANGSEQDLETTIFIPEPLGPFASDEITEATTTFAEAIETRS
jgi:hypothetical protein